MCMVRSGYMGDTRIHWAIFMGAGRAWGLGLRCRLRVQGVKGGAWLPCSALEIGLIS